MIASEKLTYTVGHSNHSIKTLINYLNRYFITTVFDVRSHPYSRCYPQFRYEALRASLAENRIAYLYYGKALGARTKDPDCYVNGRINFNRLAATKLFQDGMHLLLNGILSGKGCMLCAEKDPLTCHRTILICRHLKKVNIRIKHILGNGDIEDLGDTEKRLLHMLNLSQQELFSNNDSLMDRAYDLQGKRITRK